MLREKVKYSKRNLSEGFDYVVAEPKKSKRDFGATWMTLKDLEKGIKRANKRLLKATGEKREMYAAQVAAYEERIAKRYT